MYVYIYMYIHVCTYVYIYIYIYIYMILYGYAGDRHLGLQSLRPAFDPGRDRGSQLKQRNNINTN